MILLATLNVMAIMLFLGVTGGALFTLGWLLGPGRYTLDNAGRAVLDLVGELLVMAIAAVLVVASLFVGPGDTR